MGCIQCAQTPACRSGKGRPRGAFRVGKNFDLFPCDASCEAGSHRLEDGFLGRKTARDSHGSIRMAVTIDPFFRGEKTRNGGGTQLSYSCDECDVRTDAYYHAASI